MPEFRVALPRIDGGADYLVTPAGGSSDLFEPLRRFTGLPGDGGTDLIARVVFAPSETGFRQTPLCPELTPADFPAASAFTLALRDRVPNTIPTQALIARRLLFYLTLNRLLRGGLFLVHGALCRTSAGEGIAVCGPSGVGKSTFAAKISSFWQVAADDSFYLSVRNGQVYAQPGPTWSTYLFDKSPVGLPCDMTAFLPVQSVILLNRLPERPRLEPLTGAEGRLAFSDALTMLAVNHGEFLRDTALLRRLRLAAFGGLTGVLANLKFYRLFSTLESDLPALLKDFFPR